MAGCGKQFGAITKHFTGLRIPWPCGAAGPAGMRQDHPVEAGLRALWREHTERLRNFPIYLHVVMQPEG